MCLSLFLARGTFSNHRSRHNANKRARAFERNADQVCVHPTFSKREVGHDSYYGFPAAFSTSIHPTQPTLEPGIGLFVISWGPGFDHVRIKTRKFMVPNLTKNSEHIPRCAIYS